MRPFAKRYGLRARFTNRPLVNGVAAIAAVAAFARFERAYGERPRGRFVAELRQATEGQECIDLAAARECALEAAREMVCADVKHGWLNLDHSIEVTDAQGMKLFAITYRDAFDIKGM
jgi:hypothetical protein